jgi:hypothetical protein
MRELVASEPAARLEWTGLTDAIRVLVGRGDLQPALPAENEAERTAAVRAFNAAVTALAKDSDDLGYLASPVTGGGVRVDRLTQLYLQAKRDGGDPVATLATIAERGGGIVDRNDNKLAPEEARAALAERVARLERRTSPLLERLGIR